MLALEQAAFLSVIALVRDSAAIPSAKVTVRNEGPGLSLEVRSSADGLYVSPPVLPGLFVIAVEAAGFETAGRYLPAHQRELRSRRRDSDRTIVRWFHLAAFTACGAQFWAKFFNVTNPNATAGAPGAGTVRCGRIFS